MKKYIVVSICGLAVLVALLFIGKAIVGSMVKDFGQVCIRVEDGWTGKPIEGARVVIPESGIIVYTQDDGRTDVLSIEVINNSAIGNPKQTWGDATILIYHEDYIDYALFHFRVLPGEVRDPTLLIFPKDPSGNEPFTLVEAPDQGWVGQLMDIWREAE